jgi:serine protease Do
MRTSYFLNVIFSIFGIVGCIETFGQEVKDTKESQEIIIKKKGDKATKLTVEITGNSIIVNGKPLAEFKEDGITINNRKMIIREGDKLTMMFDENQNKILENIEGLDQMDFHMDQFDNQPCYNCEEQKRLMLGVMTETNGREGVLINEIVKESPAEKAGLQKGDIIYKVDDAKINTPKELMEYIQTKKEGDKVKVYFTRGGKKMDISSALEMKSGGVRNVKIYRNGNSTFMNDDAEMPNANGDVRVFKYRNDAVDNAILDRDRTRDILFSMMKPKLGIKIQDTEKEEGVKVIDVEKGSLSATAGLQKDDIIIAIADKVIKNTDEAREALNNNKSKNNYSVKVKRNGNELLLNIVVPKKLKTANL